MAAKSEVDPDSQRTLARLAVPGVVLMMLAFGSVAWGAPSAEDRQATERELAAAREQLAAAAREVARLSTELTAEVVPEVVMQWVGPPAGRAVLGINIGAPGSEDATAGVEVLSVSPAGPADRAGLEAGDRIMRIDGVSLLAQGEGTPRERLLAHMREIEPGDTVVLEYRRGADEHRVEVVTESLGPRFVAGLPGMVGRPPIFDVLFEPGAFASLELIRLTPDLGAYFGSERGLLIVRAPKDPSLSLKDGDVLLEIGGREPSNPAHAYRILGSYQAGEKLTLKVLRHGKTLVLDIEVPDVRRGLRSPPAASRSAGSLPAAASGRQLQAPAPPGMSPPAPPADTI